jgi:hypothetical protein
VIRPLIEILNKGKTFTLKEVDRIHSKNGIYILFEKGEKTKDGMNRVVRVGINEKQDRFLNRINDHFTGNHRGSVFRKHIGRAILTKTNRGSYLPIWNLTNKQVALKRDTINWAKENEIEKEVSAFIEEYFTFSIVQINKEVQRMDLEVKLISSLAFEAFNLPSKNWLGHFHPDLKIQQSGLWNIQHLRDSRKLIEDDLIVLKNNLIQ